MMISIDENIHSKSKPIIEKITRTLSQYRDITLAFIFGSFVSERVSPASDMDVALLFGGTPDFSRVDEIRADLEKVVKRDVDIVLLNQGSPIIKMQVLKKGVLLINRNHSYESFFVRTVNEYDDLKMIRKTIEDNILRGRLYA